MLPDSPFILHLSAYSIIIEYGITKNKRYADVTYHAVFMEIPQQFPNNPDFIIYFGGILLYTYFIYSFEDLSYFANILYLKIGID